jgi:hypothetical protein
MAVQTEFVELKTQRTGTLSFQTSIADEKIQRVSSVGDKAVFQTSRCARIALKTTIITEEVEQ